VQSDLAFADWSARKVGFVKAADVMPEEVWRRFVDLDATTQEPGPPHHPQEPRGAERRKVEAKLELWLASQPDVIEQLLGFPIEVIDTQVLCNADHGGLIDVLIRRTDEQRSYVVLELKAAEVKRDAIAQALGYVGWLTNQRKVRKASCAVIGLDEHTQVPWVRRTLPADLVSVHHWDDVPLPVELRQLLGR